MIEKMVTIRLTYGKFSEWIKQDLICEKVIKKNNGTLLSPRKWDSKTKTRQVHCAYPTEIDLQNAIRDIDRRMYSNGFIEEVVESHDPHLDECEQCLNELKTVRKILEKA